MSVRHALLALLSEAPKYGLQLRQEFESKTGEVWPLNVGQVYTTLQRLERDGLVEAEDDGDSGPQRVFAITQAGVRELDDWLRTPPETTPPPRDELVIKILVALQMPCADLPNILQSHRRELIEMMQHYTRIKSEATEDDIALALVVDAETYRLDAIVRWLDSVEARTRRRPAHPSAPAAARPTRRRKAGVKR